MSDDEPIIPERTSDDKVRWRNTGLRIKETTLVRVKEISLRTGHSVNRVLNFLIEGGLKVYEKQRAQKKDGASED